MALYVNKASIANSIISGHIFSKETSVIVTQLVFFPIVICITKFKKYPYGCVASCAKAIGTVTVILVCVNSVWGTNIPAGILVLLDQNYQ